jgi:hypothetical protein
MSTKKSAQGIKHKSLVHVLEDCILALEAQGQTEQDIYSMVNMILHGWIREGAITEEYIALAKQAKDFQEQQLSRSNIILPD